MEHLSRREFIGTCVGLALAALASVGYETGRPEGESDDEPPH